MRVLLQDCSLSPFRLLRFKIGNGSKIRVGEGMRGGVSFFLIGIDDAAVTQMTTKCNPYDLERCKYSTLR